MVHVEEGTNSALVAVVANLREADVREFLAISFCESRETLAADLIRRYANREDTYAAFDGDRAVAFGAMVELRPNVVTCGFFATEDFPAVAVPVARFVKQRLFKTYREAGVHRIECVIIDGYESAMRFVQLLGLKLEAELRGYGKRGESFYQFAWVG